MSHALFVFISANFSQPFFAVNKDINKSSCSISFNLFVRNVTHACAITMIVQDDVDAAIKDDCIQNVTSYQPSVNILFDLISY